MQVINALYLKSALDSLRQRWYKAWLSLPIAPVEKL